MGLDNGIRVKNLPKEYYECFTDIDDSTPKNGEVEICYWRKCYNIRDIFLSTFKVVKNGKIKSYKMEVLDEDGLIEFLEDNGM